MDFNQILLGLAFIMQVVAVVLDRPQQELAVLAAAEQVQKLVQVVLQLVLQTLAAAVVVRFVVPDQLAQVVLALSSFPIANHNHLLADV
jgi:hypothetical protein